MDEKVIQFNKKDNDEGETKMYIGEILKERMVALNITTEQLAEESLVEKEQINRVINDEIAMDEIDELDLEFISQILYCTPIYFIEKSVREKDIINASMNRGICNSEANVVKGKLQQFANDFVFIRNLTSEVKDGGTIG